MKCLGALDRFVLRLFLLEALMQGMAGSTAGAMIGSFFAAISSIIIFGNPALQNLPLGQLILTILIAIAVGCFLSLVGVIYPAIKAARMQPVEAMRIEE
jgi:ABC-type lipoprotein release transport system permease subunit